MEYLESTLFVLLIILSFGLILPELATRIKFPVVTGLILVGSILGPNGIDYIRLDSVVSFFGFLGMTFLMLMAGFETEIEKLKHAKFKVLLLALINGFVPLAIGFYICYAFGYSLLTSFLVGTIFISSSVALIIPSLKSAGIFKQDIGQMILAAVIITDVLSLVLLSFSLQVVDPVTSLPLPLYFLLLILSVIVLLIFLPRLTNYLFKRKLFVKTDVERRIRYVIVIMMAVLAFFSVIGVHPILAAFLIGLALSHVFKHEHIYDKIHTLGYGLFIPIFFFVVGMEIDLKILFSFDVKNLLMVFLIAGLICSKFLSGYFAGRLVKLDSHDSALFGTVSIIQLTTTLAVTFAAASLNLLDSTLVTSLVILAIITTFLGPFLLNFLIKTPLKK